MTIAVVRGQASSETIDKSWESMRIDIPRAPGLGLMLDEIHYERYNKRFANDGIHESLTWENVEDSVEAFKQDYIFPEMIAGSVLSFFLTTYKCCFFVHKVVYC